MSRVKFGTGGIRAKLGNDESNINYQTIEIATLALARVIKNHHQDHRGVAIAYDSRLMSKEFAKRTAQVLNSEGIKSFLFDKLQPTPVLSYALIQLDCIAGVMITASHNSYEYNGYKCYWEDGAQIISPIDKEIMAEIDKIDSYTFNSDNLDSKLFNFIDNSLVESYLITIEDLVYDKKQLRLALKDIKIVYTALNGAGYELVPEILNRVGAKVLKVSEQCKPDSRFTTCRYPNPEDPKAFKLALALAIKEDADVIFANDPDADRIGCMIKVSKGEYQILTGNMMGTLISEYELSQRQKINKLNLNSKMYKTIVSTNIASVLAEKYQIQLEETLTGFKYIGAKIAKLENKDDFVVGYEQSNGVLVGTHAFDKDGVLGILKLVEIIGYNKLNNLSLADKLLQISKEYGFFESFEFSNTFDDRALIDSLVEKYRTKSISEIGGLKVLAIRDYKSSKRVNVSNNEITDILLPKSNVLYFELENHCWFAIRPSGTEPKIKYYVEVNGKSKLEAQALLKQVKNSILEN